MQAIEHIRHPIAQRLVGMNIQDQAAIDAALIALDGTPDKSRLGGNALVAVSLACVHAAAVSRAVTSVELILTSDPARQPGRDLLRDGQLRIPDGPGWGLDIAALSAATGADFRPIGI